MPNVLKVSAPKLTTTSWAPQPMGEITPFQALLARKRQENVLVDVDRQEELRLLVAEFRQEPTEEKKRNLLWHITCHM